MLQYYFCSLLKIDYIVSFVHYIPIATTLFSIYFFIKLFNHWRHHRRSVYIFWWMLGVFFYGAGTITESIHTLAGYHPANFRAWYIFGALLGGAPLAQGTVYLLLRKRTANILSALLITSIVISAVLVLLSPLNPYDTKLSGKLLQWTFIRYITPFINIYAFIFLVGGAIYSAVLYARDKNFKARFTGNVLIAIGGLLPGIGGSFTKFGYVEVLYITEFLGLCFIYAGYTVIKNSTVSSVHTNQAVVPAV